MIKNVISALVIVLATLQAGAQSNRVDTVAVSILDHMSAVIGDLSSCSVTIGSPSENGRRSM